jgi:hypothetical protein
MNKELREILSKEIAPLYSGTNKEHGEFVVERLIQKIRQAGYQRDDIEELQWCRPEYANAFTGYINCKCGAILQTQERNLEHWQAGHFDYVVSVPKGNEATHSHST